MTVKKMVMMSLFLTVLFIYGHETYDIDFKDTDEKIQYENDTHVAIYDKRSGAFRAYLKKVQKTPVDDIYLKVVYQYIPVSNAEKLFMNLAEEYHLKTQARQPEELE